MRLFMQELLAVSWLQQCRSSLLPNSLSMHHSMTPVALVCTPGLALSSAKQKWQLPQNIAKHIHIRATPNASSPHFCSMQV